MRYTFEKCNHSIRGTYLTVSQAEDCLKVITGRGLRCVGYTWSASAYFALQNLLLRA